jgi:hypothetical protein
LLRLALLQLALLQLAALRLALLRLAALQLALLRLAALQLALLRLAALRLALLRLALLRLAALQLALLRLAALRLAALLQNRPENRSTPVNSPRVFRQQNHRLLASTGADPRLSSLALGEGAHALLRHLHRVFSVLELDAFSVLRNPQSHHLHS